MQGTLKVTPERLIQGAEVFKSNGTNIASITTEMTNLVTGLATSFQGDAATSFISKFKMLDDDIQKLIGMVNEHSNDLIEMANTYMSTERSNEELTDSLDIDVIL